MSTLRKISDLGLTKLEVPVHPELVNFQEQMFAMMMYRMSVIEARCVEFKVHAGLPASEIVLVRLRNGEEYPQWAGAVEALLMAAEVVNDDL